MSVQHVIQTPYSLWTVPGELRYDFVLPTPTPSLNVIKGMHFGAYKRVRESWLMEVFVALNGRRPKVAIERAFLTIERFGANGELDWDNIYGGLKPLMDCLVLPSRRNPSGFGLIVDDKPKNMPFPPFVQQRRSKQTEECTRLQIFELEALTA
jgi:hypothetical protein